MNWFKTMNDPKKFRDQLLKTHFTAKVLKHPKTRPIGGYERKWFTLWLLPVAIPSYKLVSDMEVLITFSTGEKFTFVIPKTFVTDFASIPRVLWFMYPPDGKHRGAAIPHDMGYAVKSPKAFMDELFKQLLLSEGVDPTVRDIFFGSVNWFGRTAYLLRSKSSVKKASELFIKKNNSDAVYLFLGVKK